MGNRSIIKKIKHLVGIFIAIIFIVGICFIVTLIVANWPTTKPQIITESKLEKIIETSEISTFQAVYNGVAKVMNEEKAEEIDYYVSYNARIYAGFNLDDLKIKLIEEDKIIEIEIPTIEITDVNVDIASLDYIFINDKTNKSTVSAQAYKMCVQDATNEGQKETDILNLAQQNAKNIMLGLISPFVNQFDSEFQIEVTFGGN